MFIPPQKIKDSFSSDTTDSRIVALRSSHLLIGKDLAKEAFGDIQNVYMAYYPANRSLFIASIEDNVFKQLHKASQHMLKNKNLHGDKSIALHEILIDKEINATDRTLAFEFDPLMKVINVKL